MKNRGWGQGRDRAESCVKMVFKNEEKILILAKVADTADKADSDGGQ